MACLETDFLVAVIRKEGAAVGKLRELTAKGIELSITPITATELFNGAFASRDQGKIEKVEQLILSLPLLQFDFFAAREAGELLSGLNRKGQKIGDFDTLTGAIALRHGEKTIISRNEKHSGKIKGLEIEKW